MEKTLLILAAGMGSRYGGLKQLEPLGPNNEFIIDYSIYDAKRVGFTKVVFIIKEENYELFKETIGKRIEKNIKTEYVFQDYKLVPNKYLTCIEKREKPLGTAHAILCAKDAIDEPFAVINADDFYGYDAFQKASSYLENIPKNHYGMVTYELGNALSDNGSCTRGVCSCHNNELVSITESKVEKKDGKIIVRPLTEDKEEVLPASTPVSMNFLLFSPDFFKTLEEEFYNFLESNKEDLSKVEYQIPTVLMFSKNKKQKTIDTMTTTSKWYGVTYKEDKDSVKVAIEKMIKDNIYPHKLWKE